MFIIVKEPRAWWPVAWDSVADDGSVVTNTIRLRFVRLGIAEYLERFGGEAGELPPLEAMANTRVVFDRIVAAWDDLVTPDGNPLPFTPENIDALLDEPNFPGGLGLAYAKFWNAIAETRLGNSAPSAGGGPAAPPKTADRTVTPAPSPPPRGRPASTKRR